MSSAPAFQISSDILNDIINKSKSYGGSAYEGPYTPTAFLPEGSHVVRIFVDPESNLIRNLIVHQKFGKKFRCPNHLKRIKVDGHENLPECQACKYAEMLDQSQWMSSPGARSVSIIYMKLYETSQPSEYWEAGKVYAIIGNKKLRDAVLGMIESMAKHAREYAASIINPTTPTQKLTLTFTKGAQGAVQLNSIPGSEAPPVELGDWYKPLSQVFIPEEFDEKQYNEYIASYEKYAKENGLPLTDAEAEAARAANPPADDGQPPAQQQAPQSADTPQQPIQQQAPAQQSAPQQAVQQPAVEDKPQPMTLNPAVAQQQATNVGNQVTTTSGQTIILPEAAIQRGCWKKFDSSDSVCFACDVVVQCMAEKG